MALLNIYPHKFVFDVILSFPYSLLSVKVDATVTTLISFHRTSVTFDFLSTRTCYPVGSCFHFSNSVQWCFFSSIYSYCISANHPFHLQLSLKENKTKENITSTSKPKEGAFTDDDQENNETIDCNLVNDLCIDNVTENRRYRKKASKTYAVVVSGTPNATDVNV